MRRLLPVVTLGFLILILVDRVHHLLAEREGEAGVIQGASDTRSATPARPAAGRPTLASRVPAAGPATPTIDRLARLATRQQLTREASHTYLDSLIVSADSVLRRWPDRPQTPLRVSIVEGGVEGYEPRLAGHVREAFERWEQVGLGVRFVLVTDTSAAEVVVRWRDHFDIDRAGQTDLTWDQFGRVRKASIWLALRTSAGAVLPDPALLAVAVHEVGHALGLPHSADSNDVMFPATRTGHLSERDRRTAQVLYRLPPGPVRDEIRE